MTDERRTFDDFRRLTTVMARTLFGEGLRRNDVIAIISENSLEFPPLAFGAICLNAIVSPLNITYTERKSKRKSYRNSF